MIDMSWEADAICKEIGTEAFYPDDGRNNGDARAICTGRCPVIDECLEYAMAFEGDAGKDDRFGVFGGLGPRSRWELNMQRKAAA